LDERRRELLMDVVVIVLRQGELFQVIAALRAAGGFTGGLNGRKQQSDQNRNDRDRRQQLDQREACPERALRGGFRGADQTQCGEFSFQPNAPRRILGRRYDARWHPNYTNPIGRATKFALVPRLRVGRPSGQRSSDGLLDRVHVLDTDQFLVQAAVEVGELVWIEPDQIQDRGVQVPDFRCPFFLGGRFLDFGF
jgi:hypothetical protein